MSCIVLQGRWCNIIVLNVHAPSEEKSDDSKDSFYKELEQVFNLLPKHHIKMPLGDFNVKLLLPKHHIKSPLGDFNVKLGREDIFKLTIGNDGLHQDSDDKGAGIINLATLENLVC